MPFVICEVTNQKGMHARAAAKIVTLIAGYECQVVLSHNGKQAPGDSLLKLLTLNAPKGSKIKIESVGDDSQLILRELTALFVDGFGE